MKQISVQRFALMGMLVAAAAVVALAAFAWDFARQAVTAAGYVTHTHEVKVLIYDLESSIYRAEAGQRAYLATRDTSYRDERNVAIESIEKLWTDLARLLGDNPRQLARMTSLRRELDNRIAIHRQSEGMVVSGASFSAERRIELGAQVLASIRPLISQLVSEEDRLLLQREALQKERSRNTAWIFGAFVALLLLLLPTTFWRMARDLQARSRAEAVVAGERAYDAAHARALTLYNAENDREAVLEGTLSLLAENVLFPVSAFYAFDEWAGGLRLSASRATPGDIKAMVRLDEGPVGAAARENRPIYIEGLQTKGTGLHIETGLATLRPAAVLMNPVAHQGKLLGVLAIGASSKLAPRDCEFVHRLCSQLGVALHNLGQLEEMSLLTAQLRSRGEDIQRKNAELERASRMKSEFLANMSHELRTPLNAIIGFSEIMKDGLTGPLSEEQREYVTDVHTSGKHLLSLINDILDLSKVESGQVTLDLEPTEPKVLVSSAMSVLRERAQTAHVRFTATCAPELGSLSLDARKAKQIIYNLVSNSLKFTPEGGQVTLTLNRVTAEQVRAAEAAEDTRVFPPPAPGFEHYLEMRIVDTGIGIAPGDLQQLFQAFVQIDSSLSRQYAGTGLGLTMVKRLADLHGGGLMVQSTESRGSVFSVWLPWREPSQRALPVQAAQADARHAGGLAAAAASPDAYPLVLVVEDDPRAASLMRAQIEPHGYRVEFASSGEEGLRKAAELHPDALVLDIVLPGMDGWDMLSQLKERDDTSRIPVVIVSITDAAQRGFALGAAQVLVKPVTQAQLLSALVAAGLDEPNNGARVLVVDDDPKAVALVSKHLQVAGYTPVGAYGGQEALDIVRNDAPELIVLDLMMPQVSGFDVVQGLRDHPDTAGIPVIVLTAKLLTRDDRTLLHGKVQQVMEKARFNSMGLLAEVKRALAGLQHRP